MKSKILKISIILILMLLLYKNVVNAAVSASNTTVKSGEKVSITISSSVAVSSFNAKLVDNGGLTFVSASKNSTFDMGVTNGSTINGISSSGSSKTLATYTFTAPTVTTDTTYNVKFFVSGMEGNGDSNVTAKITVKANNTNNGGNNNNGGDNTNNNSGNDNTNNNGGDKNLPSEGNTVTTIKSQDNSLKALSVNVGTLTPKFSSRITKYTVDVAEDVTSIKISATKNHSEAQLSGTGTKQLNPGVNTFNILVKAENGSTQTYTITVNKPEEKKPMELKLSSLDIKGINTNREIKELKLNTEFVEDVYAYNLVVEEDIQSLAIEAIPKEEGTIVEILGNENLVTGENVINIVLKSEDGEQTANYQIIVNKKEEINPVMAPIEEVPQGVEENRSLLGEYCIPIVVFTASVAILGLIFAIIEYKYSKREEIEIPKPVIDNGISLNTSVNNVENDYIKDEYNKEIDEEVQETEEKISNEDNIKPLKRKGKGKHF